MSATLRAAGERHGGRAAVGRRAKLVLTGVALLLTVWARPSLAQATPASPQPPVGSAAPRSTTKAGSPRPSPLVELDRLLAAGDTTAAAALLGRIQTEIDGNERLAFEAIYTLLARRQFESAREQWNRLGARLQESLRGSSQGPKDAAADAALKRRFSEAAFVQGLLASHFGSKDEALALLRQADGLGFPPLDSPLMLLAAGCLSDLHEHALATQAYKEILSRQPKDSSARLGLGIARYSSGDIAGAERELRPLLREAPEMREVRFWLGAALLDGKRNDEAAQLLDEEWRSDPRCVGCAAKLAHISYLAGDDSGCEAWLVKATAIDPSNLEATLVAGMLANRAGQYALAIRHLSSAVTLAPDSVRARYQLALAYRRGGDAAKAREQMDAYERLIAAQKAGSLGVRGSDEP